MRNKFQTPSPNAYNVDQGEEYLEERPAKSMGARLEPKTKFNTPAPNAYDADKGQDYLNEKIEKLSTVIAKKGERGNTSHSKPEH